MKYFVFKIFRICSNFIALNHTWNNVVQLEISSVPIFAAYVRDQESDLSKFNYFDC